jgi:hypothetical protein
MKYTLTLLLAVVVLAAGCTTWVQVAGRSASNQHHGNTEDNSNRSAPKTGVASAPKEKN